MRCMTHIARLIGIATLLGLATHARAASGAAEGPRAEVRLSAPMALGQGGCGTGSVSTGVARGVDMALLRWHDEHAARPTGGIIRVAAHVITAKGEGSVTDAQIAEMVRRLETDYAGTGYGFALASVDRSENPGWFRMTPGSARERQAKQALAVDPAHRLNLYICGPGQGLQGWASFPWSAPESHHSHGVVVHHASLPGRSLDLGSAATHEVGHYLGLDDDGDATTELTPAQIERMRAVVAVFRPSLFAEPTVTAASKPEIAPGAGAEPEEGRVLAYRGAFPNPFRAETALRFTLPTSQPVSLRIYSVTGQLVRTLVDATLPPGDHSAMFRADDLPSGVYFTVLRVGQVQMSRTAILVR